MMNISGKCIFTGMNSATVLDLWILGNSGVAIKTVRVTVIRNKYKVRPSLINLILSRYNQGEIWIKLNEVIWAIAFTNSGVASKTFREYCIIGNK